MNVHADTRVEALVADGGAIRVDYRSGQASAHMIADAVFFAVGWPASLGQLALAAAGVHATPGAIPVDGYLRTNVEHIFAAGDVNGRSMVVQTARMEGRIAATNAILGASRRHDYRASRRAPARVPHLHRGRLHGRAEDLPGPRHRALPAGLELSRT
jgi:pyruvate/2-oxoglutarate dehydrogenase complex dihydrolipoamide dehydrogenase (E3) component